MKKLHCFYISFIAAAVLLTTGTLSAQETFVPLLTKDTVFFAHVDFRKLDVDGVKTETKKLAETLLTTLAFDARSQRATLRDLDAELEKWDAIIRPVFDTITKEYGIRECALIADESLLEEQIPTVFAISWKGKTDNDRQKLLSYLLDIGYPILEFHNENSGVMSVLNPRDEIEDNLNALFLLAGDFLFFVPTDDWLHDSAKPRRVLTEWVKNAAADNDSLVEQALKTLKKSDEIRIVAIPPKSLIKEVQHTIPPPSFPKEAWNFIKHGAMHTEWLAISLPLSELLTGTAKEWRLATVKMSNVADAKKLRDLIEDAIEATIARAKEEAPDAPPLVFEFAKGLMRTWLPDVENDTLIFWLKSNRAAAVAPKDLFMFWDKIIEVIEGPGEVIHNPHFEKPVYIPVR